jgi:ubiquitin carboxyl-terminal hydrolase 16/45
MNRISSQSSDRTAASTTNTPATILKEEHLTSFAGMIFGGQLVSILVCEKCKNVSYTYEEFNDLSLPIKAEDYVRISKREKLKSLARKFTKKTGVESGYRSSENNPRPTSLPSSSRGKVLDLDPLDEFDLGDTVSPTTDLRRRSLDMTDKLSVVNSDIPQMESVDGTFNLMNSPTL